MILIKFKFHSPCFVLRSAAIINNNQRNLQIKKKRVCQSYLIKFRVSGGLDLAGISSVETLPSLLNKQSTTE